MWSKEVDLQVWSYKTTSSFTEQQNSLCRADELRPYIYIYTTTNLPVLNLLPANRNSKAWKCQDLYFVYFVCCAALIRQCLIFKRPSPSRDLTKALRAVRESYDLVKQPDVVDCRLYDFGVLWLFLARLHKYRYRPSFNTKDLCLGQCHTCKLRSEWACYCRILINWCHIPPSSQGCSIM